MAVMARYPNKFFNLAVVDPPYGIGVSEMTGGAGLNKKWKKNKNWDNKPPGSNYFKELFRVSKNQIIWGGNYFNLSPTKCFLIWDKKNDGRDFADCEYCWTSFDTVARMFRMRPQNMDGGKIHPTQKPVALYDWIYHNYAKPGDLILDTHLGSGSSRIAAHKTGLSFVGCELDKEYFDAQEKRFKEFTAQLRLF